MNEINNRVERQSEVQESHKTAENLRNQQLDNKTLGDELNNQEYSFDETDEAENENPEGSLQGERLLDDNLLSEEGEDLKNQGFEPEQSEIKRELLTEGQEAKVKDIVEPHYDKAINIAENATKDGTPNGEIDRQGAYYTDHNKLHVEEVTKDTIETLDATVEAIQANRIENPNAEGDVKFSSAVDYKVTQAAAMSHDTGMSDNGYVFVKGENNTYTIEQQNPYDFPSVRSNHTANSALNVLANREQYIEAGFTDTQVDEIAMLTYSHSKSNSGIKDLNSSESWNEGFTRMEAFVDAYNKDHPDNQISFDSSQLKDRMDSLATEALALRVGDVSRDSGPDSISQSGEIVHVDKNEVDVSNANSWKEETQGFDVYVGDELIDNEKSKQVHAGEQNIVENHTTFENDKLTHTITVNDGNYAPFCTAEGIKDHIGELASAKNGNFVVDIKFNEACDKETVDKYNKFRNEINRETYENSTERKYSNVKIIYPWDKE